MNTAVRAASCKDNGGQFRGANTSSGSDENDEVISLELASLTEGVGGCGGSTRDGEAKVTAGLSISRSRKGDKEFCLA